MKILLVVLTSLSFALGQSLQADEQRYLDLEKDYLKQLQAVDSLQNVLDTFLKELEQVKGNDPDNKQEISAMMAQSLVQSKKVDIAENELSQQEKVFHQLRQKLYNSYSTKIDSLEKAATNNQLSVQQENLLRELKNKRLYVSPLLTQISFNPGLIEKIKLNDSHDAKQARIYREYLNNALTELDSNITNLQKKGANIRELIRLTEKAEDFMDDIEGDQFPGAFVVAEQALNSEYDGFGREQNSPLTQVGTVAKIYNRLSPYVYENITLYDYTLQDSVYSDDYLKLLEETEKALRLYREKIKDKLQ